MKIGIDISQVVYEGTGSARYVDRLVRGFKQNEEFNFVLFGSALQKFQNLDKYNKSGLKTRFYRLPPRFFELLWNEWHGANFELFCGKVDIYHSSDWTQAPSKAIKVTTVHDLIPFKYPDLMHPRIKRAHERRWRWIIDDNVYVIVDAECTKKDIIERFGLSDSRIAVIPLGVDERFLELGKWKLEAEELTDANDKFLGDMGSVMEKYELRRNAYILCVGTMEPRKNLQRLVSAYEMFSKEMKEQYELVIVGKKAWADQLKIENKEKIKLTGYVDDDDLPYLYAGAMLFVMPSLYEGFGLPVLEAMACATPVLCSKISSLPEIGLNTVQYLQDPSKQEILSEDLQSALLSQTDVNSAYKRASELTWQTVAKNTLEVYRNL